MNVRSKKCEHPGCSSISPVFDFPEYCQDINTSTGSSSKGSKRAGKGEGKGRYCGIHKLEGMVNVKSKKCHHPGCSSVSPSFDFPGGIGRYCGPHKQPNMVSIRVFQAV